MLVGSMAAESWSVSLLNCLGRHQNTDSAISTCIQPSMSVYVLQACSGSLDRAGDWLFSHADDLDAAVANVLSQHEAANAHVSGAATSSGESCRLSALASALSVENV